MVLGRLLSKSDGIILLEMIDEGLKCSNETDFKTLIGRLSQLIPYEYALSALAQMNFDNSVRSYDIININYPTEWLALYFKKDFYKIDPIVIENFDSFRLQYWADTYRTRAKPKEFVSIAEDFGLNGGYTFGVANPGKKRGSLFSISGRSIEKDTRAEVILQHLIPHFHQALCRVLTKKKSQQTVSITLREKEILCWLTKGKSSWDISHILGISERTVNFHIYNIMQKLDAVNRLQAVATAVQLGFVDIG
jgi:LuxR family transcriptional regulator, quorum-sensing system regulator CviR